MEDYNTASTFVANYLAFDPQTIQLLLHDTIISIDDIESDEQQQQEQPPQTVNDASRIMEQARTNLLSVCDREFERAVYREDDAGRETWMRFWKLYPRLGEPEHGLEKLCVYLSAHLVRKHFQIALDIGETEKGKHEVKCGFHIA